MKYPGKMLFKLHEKKIFKKIFLNIFDKLLKKVEKIWKYILYQKNRKHY